MNNLSLYQITADQRLINELLEASEGEMTPEIEEALALNEANLQQKSAGYVYTIEELSDYEERLSKEIARLQRRKKSASRIKDILKTTLSTAMVEFGLTRLKNDTHTISLHRSKAVVIEDESKLPACYTKVKLEIDKAKLKEDLKNGEVAGAYLQENISVSIR